MNSVKIFLFLNIMMPGSKAQKAVRACTIRLLNLGPAKHEVQNIQWMFVLHIVCTMDENGNWVDSEGNIYTFGEKGVTDSNGNFYPY